MKTYQLLFPSPITIADAPEDFKKDHDFLINTEYVHNDKRYAPTSANSYLLKDRDTPLTKWLQDQINEFAIECLATRSKLKITQAWCLKHENMDQHLMEHAHCNSIVSGAYYVHAPEGTSNLTFSKGHASNLHPNIIWETDDELVKDRPWTWEWHTIPVTTGRLVLFPSQLNHGVNSINNTDMRCVLSFNTWFDGPFGDPTRLRELKV
jgi:uncharacterized protein (TIGR02466 family)